MGQKYVHDVTDDFWDHYFGLPKRIRRLAMNKRELMKENPKAVNLKKVNGLWSARVNPQYRALGVDHEKIPNGISWFWIGKHDKYDRLING